MKRGEPLNRKTPLQQRAMIRTRAQLRSRSAKRAKFYREERVPLTVAMLAESPWCEVCPKISGVDRGYDDCQNYAIGLHEILKRSQGGSMTDRDNLLRTCAPGNSWIENNPVQAHEAGLVRWRGDE